MDTDPRECMFCHEGLPKVVDEPVNLAFMSHIGREDPCREAFEVWADNMQTDHLG